MSLKCCNEIEMSKIHTFVNEDTTRIFKLYICNICGAVLKKDEIGRALIGITFDNQIKKHTF